mgnify:CR=1 FL=1
MIYRKATPIHVRGALLYNHYLKEKNITLRYSAIKEGEKIKFVYLQMPNKTGENVMSFFQTMPKEFDIHGAIDWDMQFEKGFLSPVKFVLDVIGWEPVKRNTLEFLFA